MKAATLLGSMLFLIGACMANVHADELVQVAAHRNTLALGPSKQPLLGFLAKPDGSGPFPAVVLLHGCDGFSGGSAVGADLFKSWGYVALALDSLGGTNACVPHIVASGTEAEALDAYTALGYLAREAFIDPNRIAVVGYSMGAGAALDDVERNTIEQFYPRR